MEDRETKQKLVPNIQRGPQALDIKWGRLKITQPTGHGEMCPMRPGEPKCSIVLIECEFNFLTLWKCVFPKNVQISSIVFCVQSSGCLRICAAQYLCV